MSHDSQFTLIAAGVTGVLFGIHPLHVESVAWVAERKDLLCALFYLLSIMSYVKYATDALQRAKGMGQKDTTQSAMRYRSLLYALCFFALALMSKPMAVSLPIVLLILDWYPFERISSFRTFRTACIEKLPFIGLSLISSIFTLLAQKTGGSMELMEVLPLSTRLLVAANSFVAYLWKMIAPIHLIPFYPYPENISPFSPGYLLPIFLLAGITAVCVIAARRKRVLLSVWGYYLVTLLPVIGIVQVGQQSMADRYTYLPGLGPFLLLGLLGAWIWSKLGRLRGRAPVAGFAGVATAIVILFSLVFLAIQQIGIWKDNITLWTYVIEEEPGRVPLAYNNRGLTFSNQGWLEKAIADFTAAIALNPYEYRYYNNRGEAFGKKGLHSLAINDYEQALALNQKDAKVFVNRGLIYFSIGEDRSALFDFIRACELGDSFGCTMRQYIEKNGV